MLFLCSKSISTAQQYFEIFLAHMPKLMPRVASGLAGLIFEIQGFIRKTQSFRFPTARKCQTYSKLKDKKTTNYDGNSISPRFRIALFQRGGSAGEKAGAPATDQEIGRRTHREEGRKPGALNRPTGTRGSEPRASTAREIRESAA
jgi:hypothetical protein